MPVPTRRSLPLVLLLVGAMAAACTSRLVVPGGALGALVPAGEQVVTVDVLDTGGVGALKALTVDGGDLEATETAIASVLVRHPQGMLLIDAGFGRRAQEHFRTTPITLQLFGSLRATSSILDELAKRGLAPSALKAVVLTHAHWDHVSGLEDMLGEVPVLLHPAERAFIDAGGDATGLVRPWAPALDLQTLAMDDGPFLGFPESEDLFGDGSVVAIALGGHTPGSLAVFLRLGAERSALLIGDVSWTTEGVAWPAEKPSIARSVEHDEARVRELLIHLHRLAEENPGMLIVPAHDRAALLALGGGG